MVQFQKHLFHSGIFYHREFQKYKIFCFEFLQSQPSPKNKLGGLRWTRRGQRTSPMVRGWPDHPFRLVLCWKSGKSYCARFFIETKEMSFNQLYSSNFLMGFMILFRPQKSRNKMTEIQILDLFPEQLVALHHYLRRLLMNSNQLQLKRGSQWWCEGLPISRQVREATFSGRNQHIFWPTSIISHQQGLLSLIRRRLKRLHVALLIS